MWPTATVKGDHNRAGLSPTSGDGLAVAAKRWATPTAADSEGTTSHNHACLRREVRTWATPSARDWRDGRASETTMQRNARPLNEQVVSAWPTPNAGGGTGYMSGTHRDTWRPTLEGMAQGQRAVLHRGRPAPTTSKGGDNGSPPAVLNPRFVEALMGLPIGWTDCGPSETPSCRSRPRPPSANCSGG
jgi:hypothetical protein